MHQSLSTYKTENMKRAKDLNLGCKGLWVIVPNQEFSFKTAENNQIKSMLCNYSDIWSSNLSFNEVKTLNYNNTMTEDAVNTSQTAFSITTVQN